MPTFFRASRFLHAPPILVALGHILLAGCSTNVVYLDNAGAGGATTKASSSSSTSGTTSIPTGTPTMPMTYECTGSGCETASDCLPYLAECVIAGCTDACCTPQYLLPGVACTQGGGNVCDGEGQCVDCLGASDCPATGTDCAVSNCYPGHVCTITPAAKGVPCKDNGGVICDGQGTCVAGTCTDGIKDGSESDVDCGGPTCPKCVPGKVCLVGGDCTSGVCQAGVCT